MNDYKRLTERMEDGTANPNCSACKYNEQIGDEYMCRAPYDCEQKICDRLAELEDEIENGTLVELPAPLGSELWHIQMPRRKIGRNIVESLTDYRNARVEKAEWTLSLSRVEMVGKYYFLTKEQAEARLKELKEKKRKMKNRETRTTIYLILVLCMVICCIALTSCREANVVKHNIQRTADRFDVYRKITFVNLQTGALLYSAEGYFSLQTTVDNAYQGQQEIGLIFKVGEDSYKMDYFSINNNVAYVIEQTENTTTDPYHWKIIWYVPTPEIG